MEVSTVLRSMTKVIEEQAKTLEQQNKINKQMLERIRELEKIVYNNGWEQK